MGRPLLGKPKPKQFRFGFGQNKFWFRCFGYIHFRLKYHVLAQLLVKNMWQNHKYFGRNTEIRPKLPLSSGKSVAVFFLSFSVFLSKFCFVCPLAATCSLGFVKCFVRVPRQLGFQKTYYKTFGTSCHPRLYVHVVLPLLPQVLYKAIALLFGFSNSLVWKSSRQGTQKD